MMLAFLLQVLLLACSLWQTCRGQNGANSLATPHLSADGVYTLQLASTDCYLSYENRTCARNQPVVRPKTTLWNKWAVRVVDREQGFVLVTLSASAEKGRCPNGTLSRSAEDWCMIPPYATRVGLSDDVATPPPAHELFQLVPVENAGDVEGLYHVVAVGKPSTCARYLGATGCTSRGVRTQLAVGGEAGVTTSWKLTLVSADPPAPLPAPAPTASPPSPSPSPSPVPGPIISAPSSTTWGSVTVLVQSSGGNSECSVSSFLFTMTGSGVGSLPQTVEVPASRGGLSSVGVSLLLPQVGRNTVYAVGMCQNGGTTERSNVLEVTVLSVSGGLPALPAVYGWVSQTSAADNNWRSVTWGGPSGQEKFVAVASSGDGNRVMTSPDGVTWTLQTSAADNNWYGVTWGGPAGQENFVAVATSGTGNRVMTSATGL